MNSIIKRSIVVIVMSGLFITGVTNSSTMASQELASKQEVVMGLPTGDIGTMDPMGGILIQDRVIYHHVYSGLVRYPIGNAGSLEFEPDLATKWEVSPDKLTWTFHLRKGVKWHWGFGEVTSEDVVYSIKRARDSKASAFRGERDIFKEIKAIDKYTVQIITFKSDPFLLFKVANQFGGSVVCKKALEKAGAFDRGMRPIKEEVIGTGPFKFVEYTPKDRTTLVRNDDYWEGKPIIEELIGRYIPDESAREMALLKGEISSTLGLYDPKWLKYIRREGIIVDPMGPLDLKALYFNLKIKPFNDKRVREAFAYATSQESIFKMQGEEISSYCTSPVPSRLAGHIDAGWAKYKYDPEKAKKLLAEAGYPDGLTVKIFMSIAPWYLDKMIVYQSEWRECGINLEISKVDHTVYKTKIAQGLNPIVIWGGRYPSAIEWLRTHYHTDSIIGTPKAKHNYMYYSNPEVDRLIELAETTYDEKTRLDALAKAQRIIVQDLSSIPVIETFIPTVRNPWLDLGYEPKSNLITQYEIGLKTRILKH